MNKSDLVRQVAEKAGITISKAKDAVEGFMEVVSDSLENEGDVTLVGFGRWATVDRKARKGRNPRTGDVIDIPKAKVVKFRPGKELKNRINKG